MTNRPGRPVLAALLMLACAPGVARSVESKRAAPPPAPSGLAFRGWALTSDFQLAQVYGNATQYTVRWYADLSYLPWNTDVSSDGYGGLASDPWNPNYLYLAVSARPATDEIYRFDLTTNTASYLLTMPYVMYGWTLQGLGARCTSALANTYGGVPFYSHRRYHPATSYNVRELTTAGVETNVYTSTDYSTREGDNSQELFGGPHWFTWQTWNASGLPTWGVSQLSTASIVMGTNDGRTPTGMLSYGSGAFYVSTMGGPGNGMFVVNTYMGVSNPLTYVVSGPGAYPTAPFLTDLSNQANYCTLTEPPVFEALSAE